MKTPFDKASPAPQRGSLPVPGQTTPAAGGPVHPILRFQQTVGNRAVQRLLGPSEPSRRVQPGTVTGSAIQRDLKAHNEGSVDISSGEGPDTVYIKTTTAEAPGLRSALSALISAGRVREVQSKSGETSWFAAAHDQGTSLSEIESALSAAGYGKAGELAEAIFDRQGEFLYTDGSLTVMVNMYSEKFDLGEKVEKQTSRSLTEWEISEARKVFGGAIKYSEVTIEDGSPGAWWGSLGGYARTVGNTIYFPDGSSRNMTLLIHELSHVWQYQTIGPLYAPKAIGAQMGEGYDYTEGGKTAEQSLLDARAEGRTLYGFNKEQQGDILRDYYRRLQEGKDVSAWQPFVDDVQTPPDLFREIFLLTK